MTNPREAQQLLQIEKTLARIADALETQNKLINDVLYYPSDTTKPPYVLVGCNTPLDVITF